MNHSAPAPWRGAKLLKLTGNAWLEHHALRLSAALAYYSIFSIAPLLIIAISVAGLVFGADAVRGHLDEQLQGYVGAKTAESVQSMVRSASKPSHSWIAASIGFVTLLLGASGVFAQLKDALNTIWEVKIKPGTGIWSIVRGRLLNFGMVLIIGFLLLVSLLLTTVLAALNSHLENLIGLPAGVGTLFGVGISLVVVTTLFAVIFKVLPDAEVEWRSVWIGAAVTALLFEVGKFGLSFYLGRESTASSFGAAGSVVLLLLWVYYASCILLFGAEFTRVYARESGHRIQPAEGAVSVVASAQPAPGCPSPNAALPAAPVPRIEIIEVPAPPPERNPLGALLAVVAGSFVVGLLARRRAGKRQTAMARIGSGLAELGQQTAENITGVADRARENFFRWRKR